LKSALLENFDREVHKTLFIDSALWTQHAKKKENYAKRKESKERINGRPFEVRTQKLALKRKETGRKR